MIELIEAEGQDVGEHPTEQALNGNATGQASSVKRKPLTRCKLALSTIG